MAVQAEPEVRLTMLTIDSNRSSLGAVNASVTRVQMLPHKKFPFFSGYLCDFTYARTSADPSDAHQAMTSARDVANRVRIHHHVPIQLGFSPSHIRT